MSKKLYFLIFFVSVLVLAGNVLAYETVTWDNNNLTGDQLWDTAQNWDILGPPKGDFMVPDANTWVGIDAWADPCNCPIIDANTDAVGEWIGLGELAASGQPVMILKMTGGTLTAVTWFEMGGYYTGNFRLDISGGTLTAPYMWIGYQLDSYATINMSGGTINTTGALSIGTFDTSYAEVNMTGGDVNLGGRLEIGAYRTPRRGVGHVDMHGGTIETIQLRIGGGGVGSMDFAYDGTLIIDGDYRMPNGWLFDPLLDDASNQGEHTGTIAILTDRGIITAYDVNVGMIIGGQYPSVEGKRALINLDYNNVNPGQTTITAGADDSNLAWDPAPLFGEADLSALDINLISWAAGDNAVKHDVYFGTTFAEVNEATTASDPNIYLGRQLLADVNSPPGFVTWHKTYYWRIDEVNDSNEPQWKGRVWNFATRPAWARNPIPTGAGAALFPVLKWTSGPVVATTAGHYVYFSSDFNDVNDRDPSFLTIRDTNDYRPTEMLEFSKQYWWAVDEVNNSEDPNVWPSPNWDFTTEAYLFVDNMESYVNDEAMKAITGGPWNDYYTIGSRADLYIETAAALVHNGTTSMRFHYINDRVTGGGADDRGYSEAWANTLNLWAGEDWTVADAKALVLSFRGKTTNTEPQPLYLVLVDNADNEGMVTYDDANGVQENYWHTWNIDLGDPCFSGVDMNNVEKIWLGVGIRGLTVGPQTGGGEGDVYFDDIDLHPSRCFPEQVETDISGGCIRGDCLSYGTAGDCNTDYLDLDVMAGDWLEYDYNVPAEAITVGPVGWWKFDEGVGTTTKDSAGDNDGTIIQASWSDGYPTDPNNSGLYFNADSIAQFDHVKCAVSTGDHNKPGEYPAELMPTTFTVACWLKVDPDVDAEYYFDSPVVAGVDEGEQSAKNCGFYLWSNWNSFEDRGGFGLGISIGENDDGEEWYPRTPIQYPVNTWYHFAATYDGVNIVCLYVDGKEVQPINNAGNPQSTVGGPINWMYEGKYPPYFVIGGLPVQYSSDWFFFNGNIDDVRLYNYAMSDGQIVTLAEQGPVLYHEIVSPANLSDDEAKTSKIVNFKDYRILADHWLEGPILWPSN